MRLLDTCKREARLVTCFTYSSSQPLQRQDLTDSVKERLRLISEAKYQIRATFKKVTIRDGNLAVKIADYKIHVRYKKRTILYVTGHKYEGVLRVWTIKINFHYLYLLNDIVDMMQEKAAEGHDTRTMLEDEDTSILSL